MKTLLILSALVAAVIADPPNWYKGGPCGQSKYADAGSQPLPPGMSRQIVGGVPAQPNEFPWTCSVRRKATNGHFCGCSIINELWILTAAHCMSGETPAIVSIVVGDHIRNAASDIRQTFDVASIIMHENYNSRTYVNDVALVKLAAPITFTENIQPVCGPEPTDLYEYRLSWCAGWGTLSSGGACCPQQLQYVSLNITTNQFCDAVYRVNNITPDMICASDNVGGTERDSCQGDSGGPLMVQDPGTGIFTVVGVVSWGIGCASNYPGVYARVSYQNDWILSKIN
jgi:secreted trypsin-like serine protease